MEDYEEAVEKTITLYADAKPYAQVIYRANGLTTCNVCFAQAKVFNDLDIRNVADLYSEDYELQRKVLVRQNAKVKDVAKLLENGDICYSDACEWCMENDIPLGQFDRCLYGELRKSDNPARVEPKEPWPYRVVAGINRVLEILLNSILEDCTHFGLSARTMVAGIRGSWSRQKISRRLSRKAWLLRRNMLRVISVGTGLAD